jgi:hypothetical protein
VKPWSLAMARTVVESSPPESKTIAGLCMMPPQLRTVKIP